MIVSLDRSRDRIRGLSRVFARIPADRDLNNRIWDTD